MPKIDLYPDSKLPCLSAHLSKENRPFHRPIGSAIGTGGLDFLIAHALLILCHSLFKVVINDIPKRRKIIINLIFCVNAIVHGYRTYMSLRKKNLRIVSDHDVIAPEPRHIFHDNRFHQSGLHIRHHSLKIGSIEIRSAIPVVCIESCIFKTMLPCILGQNFFLLHDAVAVTLYFIVTAQSCIQGCYITSVLFCCFPYCCLCS